MSNKKDNLTGYPSIDKPWLKYYSEEAINAEIPKCTVYENVYQNNKDFPNDTAILYFGKKISYGTLFEKTETCVRALSAIGIGKGDIVNLCTAGIPEAVYLMLACNRLGALTNFINPLFSAEQMIARINDTDAEWLFVLDEMYSYIESAIPSICSRYIVVIPVNSSFPIALKMISGVRSKAKKIVTVSPTAGQEYILWKDFLNKAEGKGRMADVSYEKDMPAIMVYSSGSTGASKGILLTNESINAIIQNYKRDTFYGKRTDTFLSMVPVWFSTGIVLSLIMPIAHGVCVIPEPKFSKERFARDLQKYKPTMTLTATSFWLYVATADETKDIDLSNMIYPSTGGEKSLKKMSLY